jgi:hypothetical protein
MRERDQRRHPQRHPEHPVGCLLFTPHAPHLLPVSSKPREPGGNIRSTTFSKDFPGIYSRVTDFRQHYSSTAVDYSTHPGVIH